MQHGDTVGVAASKLQRLGHKLGLQSVLSVTCSVFGHMSFLPQIHKYTHIYTCECEPENAIQGVFMPCPQSAQADSRSTVTLNRIKWLLKRNIYTIICIMYQ